MEPNSHFITINCGSLQRHDRFEVDLGKEFKFQDYWEIGLKEISFQKTWFTLPIDQLVQIVIYDPLTPQMYSVVQSSDSIIKRGDYEIRDLVNKVNRMIDIFIVKTDERDTIKGFPEKLVTFKPQLYLDENHQRVFMLPGIIDKKFLFFFKFETYLTEILGFPEQKSKEKFETLYKDYKDKQDRILPLEILEKPNMSMSFRTYDKDVIKFFMITADICDYTVFNNHRYPILRMVDIPVNTKFSGQITKTYENPVYFPLGKNAFNKIKFNIYDNLKIIERKANVQPYLLGEMYMILHLRKSNARLLRPILEPLPEGVEDNSYNAPEDHPLAQETPDPLAQETPDTTVNRDYNPFEEIRKH